MCVQEHLLDLEYDNNALGVDQLLGQSDPEDKPMEQDNKVIIVEEHQSEDPGSLLAFGEKDLFSQEEDLSNFQLVAYINTSTQKINRRMKSSLLRSAYLRTLVLCCPVGRRTSSAKKRNSPTPNW